MHAREFNSDQPVALQGNGQRLLFRAVAATHALFYTCIALFAFDYSSDDSIRLPPYSVFVIVMTRHKSHRRPFEGQGV